MLICGHLNTFPNTLWGDGIWYLVRTERKSVRMSKIKNSGLDQYGAEPFEQQQLGTASVEAVKEDGNGLFLSATREAE